MKVSSMGNPRMPVAKANATGAAFKNPTRYRNRPERHGAPLGDAPDLLNADLCAAWTNFCREIPWLMESDRAMMEIVATLRGRSAADESTAMMLGVYQAVWVSF